MIKLKDIELNEDEYGYLNGRIPYDYDIGFDVTKMNIFIYYVDWSLFDKCVEEGTVKVNIAPKNKPEQCLTNLPGNTKYKSVVIKISEYEKLKIQKSNIPTKDDFAILEVHVQPMFEIMGNINNYSCEELQNRVKVILDILAAEYGLMCESTVLLNSAEININFSEYIDRDKINYEYYKWLLAPYQYSLDKDRFKSAYYHVPKEFAFTPEMYPTGLRSKSETLKINIYDKAFETMDSYNNKKASKQEKDKRHKIEEMTPLTRIEFGIQKTKQIISHFGKSNLMELEQADVEAAFMGLFDKYVYEPVLKYQTHMDLEMRYYFSHIDMSNRKWKMELIKYLSTYRDATGYLCLDLESIGEYVKLIPGKSIKAHAARIRKDIINEIYSAFTVGETILLYNKHNVELLKNRIIDNQYGPKEIEFKLAPEYYRMLKLIVENPKYNEEEAKALYKKEIEEYDPDFNCMKELYRGLNIRYYI